MSNNEVQYLPCPYCKGEEGKEKCVYCRGFGKFEIIPNGSTRAGGYEMPTIMEHDAKGFLPNKL